MSICSLKHYHNMDESLFFKLYEGLPRQGPGDDKCTCKAFGMIPGLKEAQILDIGCGSGMQTLEIARSSPDCHITAVDVHQPFLDDLMSRAVAAGVAERINTVCASMDGLLFEHDSFDVIWSEGSIFVLGLETGLKYWKQFLRKGGYIALTEATWFVDEPSSIASEFFELEYPAMTSIQDNEQIIRDAGYTLMSSFKLPASAWWDNYYIPLERRLADLEKEYIDNNDMQLLIGACRKEIALFTEHSHEYGYTFFVLRK